MVNALCNALVQSLWQGVLLAAVAGLIVIATKRSTAALRYNLLAAALTLFAAGVMLTFVLRLAAGHDGRSPAVHAIAVRGTDARVADVRPAANPSFATTPSNSIGNIAEIIAGFSARHDNIIVLVWFLIICARSCQLCLGIFGTYRLKRTGVSALKDHWNDRVQQLAIALGIKQSIAFLESSLVKVPVVIGYLRPVVLVPIGLLTALSPTEAEAILIHELAHIRRRDTLVNLLQYLVEMSFFFNPAVWWVSGLIRAERENCCDDLALLQNDNKVNYIRALLACVEYQSPAPPFAVALAGGRNSLLQRIRRLAGNRNHSLNRWEKTVLAVCLVAAGSFTMAFSAAHRSGSTIPADTAHVMTRAVLKPAVRSAAASAAIQKPATIQPHGRALPVTAAHRAVAIQPASDTSSGPIVPDLGDTLVKYNILGGKFDMTARLNSRELVINGVKQPEDVRALVFAKFLNDSVHSVDINYVYKSTSGPGADRGPGMSAFRYKGDDEGSNALRNAHAAQQTKKTNDWAAIKSDLINEGLVSDTNKISFTLRPGEFILNGQLQGPEVTSRYSRKYIPANASPLWYWGLSENH